MTMAFAVIALFLALLMPAGLNPTRHPPRADA